LIISLLVGGYFAFFAKQASAFDSVAVLPFVNASGNQETEFLSEGISETLINNFTRIPSLRVTARSTAFRYKGTEKDLQIIGRELNVGAILTGKIMQRDDSLSVQVDLINAADGTQIWGNQYNGKTSEILDIQQRIGRDVSEQLKLKLSGAQEQQITKNYTANAQAYQHYLKGRFYWNRRTEENLKKAIQEFQQAIEIDPNFALAYVGLADSYAVMEQYTGTPTIETLPKAKAYAERALQIDEQLAEAHASLGLINGGLWQWAEAEKEFKRAIELNPNYPTAHHWYSIYLRRMGRYDEGLQESKRAHELDPLSGVINTNLVIAYLLKGDVNAALDQSKKMIELEPNSWLGHNSLAMAYLKQGRYDEAIGKLQETVVLSQRSPLSLADLGYALAISGRRAEALAIVKELEERYARREALGSHLASVYAGLGEKDQAFAWLEKDFQARSGLLPNIFFSYTYEPLRADPRYADLLRRMNLPH
jgi:eukaryotic-like serine/threonine-protein kinase